MTVYLHVGRKKQQEHEAGEVAGDASKALGCLGRPRSGTRHCPYSFLALGDGWVGQ